MSPRTRVYLNCVIASGLVLLVDGLFKFAAVDAARFFTYLGLALIAATWKVRMPGMRGTFSTVFVFILIGIANYSLGETLVMGCGGMVVQCLWKPREKPSLTNVMFNVAVVATGVMVAYNPPHYAMAQGLWNAPAMLSLAAVLFFVVNTGLVSGAIALTERKPLRLVWRRWVLLTLPYYLAGALVATLMIVSNRLLGWASGILILPLMYLMYYYYRLKLRRRRVLES